MNICMTFLRALMMNIFFMLVPACSLYAGNPGLNNELEKLMSDPAFQQEMERMNKMIESDPALQAEVNKLLTDPEFQQAMDQMFEDPAFQEELAKELQRMPEAPVAPIEQYQPTPSKPVEPIKKDDLKKPTRDMSPTIDAINVSLENFLQKTAQYPDMASNFEKWTTKRRIELGTGLTWDSFKDKVEKLKKSLYEIKAVDFKTQKPKYLPDLAANEGLCNNLEKFRSDLVRHEHDIKVKFGKPVTPESKKAIVEAINDCLSAISVLKIQDELEKIIVKYDPVAKKLKEEEEKREKSAVAVAQRRPGQPAPVRVSMGGRTEAPGYYQEGLPSGERGHGGFGPSPYMPGGYPSKPYGEQYKPTKPETGTGKGKAAGKKAGDKKKKEEPKKAEAPKKEDDKKTAGIEEALEKMYDDTVRDKLRTCTDIMDVELASIATMVTNPKKVGDAVKILNNLSSTMNNLGRNEIGPKVHQKIWDLSGSTKNEFINMFKRLWKDFEGSFKKFQKQLTQLDSSSNPELKDAIDSFNVALGSLGDKFLLLHKQPKSRGKRARSARSQRAKKQAR